jgi:hypothetical protein
MTFSRQDAKEQRKPFGILTALTIFEIASKRIRRKNKRIVQLNKRIVQLNKRIVQSNN